MARQDDRFTLIHWWDSEDDIVENKWTDRIGGLQYTAYNPYKAIDGSYRLDTVSSPNRYFWISSLNGNLRLPARWRMEAEVSVEAAGSSFAIDFGSIGIAPHAFGATVNSDTGMMFLNYKLFGNASGSVYGPADTIQVPFNTMIKICWGCTRYDDDNDICYIEYGDTVVYGKAPHGHTVYDGNWSQSIAYIGRGVLAGAASGRGYIRSLKIFTEK